MSNNLKRTTLSFFNKETSETKNPRLFPLISSFLLFGFIFICGSLTSFSQVIQPNYYNGNQPPTNNYMANSSAFRQEIARMEINVVRQGKAPLSITQVPRLEKDDVLKIRLLEEQVNGMKPDQGNWDWSFLVAFVNPARNNAKEESVSEEIQFRKSGWYKQYSFVVPYDSQPIFFLYPKPKYRAKILNLINKNQEDVRKIGEKTIELSDAYAKIGSFLNELQSVVNMSSYGGYGGYGGGYGGYGSSYGNSGSSYGGTSGSTYGSSYSSYGYGNYGSTPGFNLNMFMNQSVERLARSFNIQLPSCWQNGGYGSYGGISGTQQGNFYGVSQDFVGRTQCIARSVRLEDFDVSVSRLLQQGGILAAAQLSQKYPQIAFWINVAAAALDFITKIAKKTPLKIVPTVITSTDNQGQNSSYQSSYTTYSTSYNANPSNQTNPANPDSSINAVKISLYAEAPPNDSNFVTAYPLVVQKWQANPDPDVISLPIPALAEPCLHPGQNILRSTDLINNWMSDNFTNDFNLLINSPNGFRKVFPLKKNVGLSGWELNVTKEDLNAFPKINMTLESVITGKRGFNEIKSPKFNLPIPIAGTWEIAPEAQKAFAVGGKRTITLRNPLGNCKCLEAVIYKPSFGGQFIFDANNAENGLWFSADGKEVSFEIDATNFQPGQGQLELKQYGGESTNLALNLYPSPPNITSLKISRGDRQATITGERLEQLRAVKINGKRAIIEGGNIINPTNNENSGLVSSAPVYTLSSSEKVFVFEDSNARQDSNVVSLELELEDNRSYSYPKTFSVSVARPSIVANQAGEVEGVAILNPASGLNNNGAVNVGNGKAISANKTKSPFTASDLPVFPINSSEILVDVHNALTDYDFKVENIQIETRIEKSQISPSELPKAVFEVLDWKNMKISFLLSEQSQALLGGRRLQFRIRDKQRGDSDWYTVRKTFARIPGSISVSCTSGTNGNCQMKGEGIEYISQVSVDGGKSWYPQEPATLTVQTAPDGRKLALIPRYSNKALLKIRLRDFPIAEGMAVK